MARRDTDEDAPWLASADGGRETTTVSRRSLFWTVIAGLVLIGAVVIGGVVLLSKKQGGATAGYMNAEQAPLIAAEPGPYKVKPDDPKGLAVDGQDQTMYAAGEGDDQQGQIDTSAVSEEPVARPGAVPTPGFEGPPRDLLPPGASTAGPAVPPVGVAPVVAKPVAPTAAAAPPTVKPAAVLPPAAKPPAAAVAPPKAAKPRDPLNIDIPSDPKPKPKPSSVEAKAAGGTAQLGAFSSEEKADAAWAALGGKTGGYAKRIVKIEKDGKTLYRLRAGGGDAGALCQRVKADGGACAVVE